MSSGVFISNCPVCGSSNIHKAVTAVDHTVSGEAFDIFQCAQCALRFTQQAPGASSIGKYYQSENYISHTNTSKGIVNRLYLIVRKFTLSAKRKLIVRITGLKKGALLDIGAGTGAFAHHMQHSGWQVTGLEQDEQAVKNAQLLFGLELKDPALLFTLPAESYDTITLWHVLEHVHALHEYVSRIRDLIRPNGKILIAVPNYTSKDAEKYGSFWAAYDVPRHLYHFSPASMNILLEQHRLKVEMIQPMWFDSYYVSLLSEKYKSGRPHLLKGFLNGFVSNSKAFANRRRASSLIYIISPVA